LPMVNVRDCDLQRGEALSGGNATHPGFRSCFCSMIFAENPANLSRQYKPVVRRYTDTCSPLITNFSLILVVYCHITGRHDKSMDPVTESSRQAVPLHRSMLYGNYVQHVSV